MRRALRVVKGGEQLQLSRGLQVGDDHPSQSAAVQRQLHAHFGAVLQLTPSVFNRDQHDLANIEHGQLHGFAHRIAQAYQLILGGQPQIEVAPDLMGQFQQAQP